MAKYVFLIFTSLTILLVSCQNKQNEDRIKPVFRDISEFVYASAKVVSHDAYQSRSTQSGIIQEIFIKEGDQVKKGQSLFKIKATADSNNKLYNATVTLNEADENLSGNNSKLNSIEIEIQRIKKQNQIDSSNYTRRNRLWEQNIGSKNELENSLLAYQSSTSRLKVLLLDYQQARLNLTSQFEKARNQVKTEQTLLADLEITSQIDGVILSLFKEVGEFISPQENFASIGNNDNFILNINIDEIDISRIAIGDTAIILLEAYPNEVYTSVLSYISKVKDESTQTFKVESTFTENPIKLFNGLSGEANVLVARRKNAIVIPSQYLLDRNKVLTEQGTLNVNVGVKNMEYVEILEGIDTATILLKPDIQ